MGLSPDRRWRPRRPRRGILALTAVIGLALSLSSGSGQTGTDGVYYSRQSEFYIPFTIDPNGRPVRQVHLHVSTDQGVSYQNAGTAQPAQKGFKFRAPRDGWYWFTVQTQDDQGGLFPPDLRNAQPGIKVCIDTTKPTVMLQASAQNGSLTADWDARDDHLDLNTLRLEYAASGAREWTPLPAQRSERGSHTWTPVGQGPFDVRLQVLDRSGNVGESIKGVNPGGRPAAPAGPAQPAEVSRSNAVMVKSKRIQLNYDIQDVGPSDVAQVDVWYTASGGQRWQKHPQPAPKTPPCVLEVPDEGRYGFVLIARSGVDMAETPPKNGDLPPGTVWVEVDTTRPAVKMLGVNVGRGQDKGTIAVSWTATDKHLGQTPMAVQYGKTPDGPWTDVATGLPNTGRYFWQLPAEGLPVFQFYIRVTATDQAGNVGHAETTEMVKVDLAVPRARISGVQAVEAGPP